ncbi:prepilin-type N-terminal cleavage/methylation domain-containing protein [Cylindrospermum sp. FACHB-282]|uniref:prepilin-type N-terminal cleavage/methylation domain-containing protein n=1 Tax=Cylindrospermum sp. FACHB-282 TaxID=2692794 RepID=UPI0016872050|nr:prepilin-type N-terminal cleavage/methylation domain-containing protein [Cylindrospermum sp. FACHB-282]MBD2385712.1 prepilin-type N-terminal cleavage/methylation domain-containing protein [Cylindrospermum sp. FACHB-282]
MENLSLKILCLIGRNKKSNQRYLGTGYTEQDAGFSLIEMLVVIVMIGILGAIAVPSWLGFVNRQRMNKANDAVLAAIQDARQTAKNKKISYSVSFRKSSVTQPIEFAIYRTKKDDGTNLTDAEISIWKPLGADLGVDSTQLLVGTNLTGENIATNASVSSLSTPPAKITFDYMGTLPSANFGTAVAPSTEPPGLKIVLAPPGGSLSSSTSLKRCVIVKTLLGSTLTAKDEKCN